MTPPTPETGGPAGDCTVGNFDSDGGTLSVDGAVLVLPVDALAPEEQPVELCRLDDGRVWIGPESLQVEHGLLLTLDHDGDEATTVLMSPGALGEPWRNLQATRPAPGQLTGPIYRAGEAWVEADDRLVTPYDPVINGAADLLFVIDNSGTMAEHHRDLIDAFTQVKPTLDATGLDYHVGVVTTDLMDPDQSGRLRSVAGQKWVEPSTPLGDAVFGLLANVGTTGSPVEQGLGAAYLALDALRDTENAGFYREEATLAIVHVTDEDDYTPPGLITPAQFPIWLEGLKVNASHVAYNAMVALVYGGTMRDIALATGGRVAGLEQPNWEPLLLDIITDLNPGTDPMTLVAVEGSVEAWYVPLEEEQQPFPPEAVLHDAEADTVLVDNGPTPIASVQLLYLPE